MRSHFTLKWLSVRKLILLLTRLKSRTATPQSNQIFSIDSFANVQNFYHFASLNFLFHYLLAPGRQWTFLTCLTRLLLYLLSRLIFLACWYDITERESGFLSILFRSYLRLLISKLLQLLLRHFRFSHSSYRASWTFVWLGKTAFRCSVCLDVFKWQAWCKTYFIHLVSVLWTCIRWPKSLVLNWFYLFLRWLFIYFCRWAKLFAQSYFFWRAKLRS